MGLYPLHSLVEGYSSERETSTFASSLLAALWNRSNCTNISFEVPATCWLVVWGMCRVRTGVAGWAATTSSTAAARVVVVERVCSRLFTIDTALLKASLP